MSHIIKPAAEVVLSEAENPKIYSEVTAAYRQFQEKDLTLVATKSQIRNLLLSKNKL